MRDILTVLSTSFPGIYIQYRWSQLYTQIVNKPCFEPRCPIKLAKNFFIKELHPEINQPWRQKQKLIPDQKMLRRLERWNSGEYGSHRKEATYMKQSRRRQRNEIGDFIRTVKLLCFQRQYGQSATILCSGRLAPDNKAETKALKVGISKKSCLLLPPQTILLQ